MILLLAAPALASGAVNWRSQPELVTEQAHGGGHNHRGGPLSFYLREAEGAEVSLWTPDLARRPVAVTEGKARVKPSGAEGYHLLAARRALPGEEQVALRYHYLPGKPSGHSPTELLGAQVSRLEVLPTPLPREHWRYETSEKAAFQVRFGGMPLANVPVRMTTSNGTLLEEISNAQGAVRFSLPEDFAAVNPGRGANAPADFVVTVAHRADGTLYTTTLNADYHANPSHWQSTLGGTLSLAAGFLVGLVLVRPRKEPQA